MIKNSLLFISSFIIVALGQPDASSILSLLASGCGFALFWLILFSFPQRKTRFLLSALWFTAVQAVQLSWMASPEYQGIYIFFVYGALILFLGIEFGLLSLLFPAKPSLSWKRLLAIAALWTLFEWSRLFILCGFAWNPIGLSMTAFPISSQLASVWGIFGLSFWTVFVNLLALRTCIKWSLKQGSIASAAFLFPFLFGFVHMQYHEGKKKEDQASYHVALIQTSLLPDQKSYFHEQPGAFVSPYDQWKSIIKYIEDEGVKTLDLIAMPEYVVPFSARSTIYGYEEVKGILDFLWEEGEDYTHLLTPTLSEKHELRGKEKWYVNNLFWAQAIADHYGAEVVLGLDDRDEKLEKSYNAAFHVVPNKKEIKRYEKRILLPLAEYLPFPILKPLIARYGISDFFTHGTKAKVFEGNYPLNISICYEECFSHAIREGKLNGAKLFVNVTNDAWYPFSRLPLKHFEHGKLRAIENGVPLVRACNTGVTAAVDSLGRIVGKLGEGNVERQKGALVTTLDLYSYSTIYTYLGDYLIVVLSLIFVGLFIFRKSGRKET